MLLVMQGVVFAYAGLELCGIAAGETENARMIVPRVIRTIMWRIVLFSVGSVLLLALLLPHTAYSADQSPFVTVFARLGVPGAAAVMNLVVLTAAPRITARMNRGHVPYGGILRTASFGVLGVVLNHGSRRGPGVS